MSEGPNVRWPKHKPQPYTKCRDERCGAGPDDGVGCEFYCIEMVAAPFMRARVEEDCEVCGAPEGTVHHAGCPEEPCPICLSGFPPPRPCYHRAIWVQ